MKTLGKVIKNNPITLIMLISAVLVFGRQSILCVLATSLMLYIAHIMDLDIRDMYKKYPNTDEYE